tara:strand:+ start:1124 stop:1474 length:351 start_codon:yes stop_codon:yes gene_type:complete
MYWMIKSMTTPLFIGESIPREVRNILKSLEIGMLARYKNHEGTIEFVCDDYITICVATSQNDDHALKKINKCCLLVYREKWDDIEIEDTHFYDVKAYTGKTNDHPGNEMLPSVTDR